MLVNTVPQMFGADAISNNHLELLSFSKVLCPRLTAVFENQGGCALRVFFVRQVAQVVL